MMNGGKVLMATGFECISKGNLENVHKRVNDPEKSARLIGKVYSYGIMVFGLDNDPPDIFDETRSFAMESRIDMCGFSIVNQNYSWAQILESSLWVN